jgi:cyclopropane-fatty-acyl-phospholipid synthase
MSTTLPHPQRTDAPEPGAPPTVSAPPGSVAEALEPLLRRLLGPRLPVQIKAWDGSVVGPPSCPTTIVITSPNALRRMLWAPGELGLARAYVAGDLELEGDVFDLLHVRDAMANPLEHVEVGIGLKDVPELVRTARALGALGRPLPPPPEEAHLKGRRHSPARDRAAIAHHYDVGNDFYRLVLGPTLTYSCAHWPTPHSTLDEAQAAKYELVCTKLGIRPGMRLLDIGCGWGGMALHAAEHHGATVVGITLSKEQRRLAAERAEAAGLADRIDFREQDYREIDDGPFDVVSSIGMFEHVGEARTAEYMADVFALVRPGGRLLNHAISRPPGPSAISDRSFIGRYVFPDGELMEVGKTVSAMQAAGFEVRDVESLREHYALTLRAWVANLEANWDEAVRLVGAGRARVWLLYMAASAVNFEQGRTAIHQVLGVRPHPDGRSDMPLTRRELLKL